MIFLESFREEGYGINFSTEEETEIVIKMIDGYTGLTMYQDRMHLHPGIMYFCGHGGQADRRNYEIWSSDPTSSSSSTPSMNTGYKWSASASGYWGIM